MNAEGRPVRGAPSNRTGEGLESQSIPSDEFAQFDEYAREVERIRLQEPSAGDFAAWRPFDLGPILDGKAPEIVPTIGHRDDGVRLFYPGRLNAVIGESESGKSFFVLVSVRQEIDAGRTVIYIDYEDTPESIVQRLRGLGAKDESIRDHFVYVPSPDGVLPSETLEHFRDLNPSLIIIDATNEAMEAHRLNPDSTPDVASFYNRTAKPLATETGAAVVVIDHVTKSREGRNGQAIGSQHKKSGTTGVIFELQQPGSATPFRPGGRGASYVYVSRDKPGQVRKHAQEDRFFCTFVLDSKPDGSLMPSFLPGGSGMAGTTEGRKGTRATGIRTKIRNHLADHPGASTRAIREGVRGNAAEISNVLADMVKCGEVTTKPGDGRAVLHTLATES